MVDGIENLTLENIRNSLIRQEDSIIFRLLKLAQCFYNADTYDPDALSNHKLKSIFIFSKPLVSKLLLNSDKSTKVRV